MLKKYLKDVIASVAKQSVGMMGRSLNAFFGKLTDYFATLVMTSSINNIEVVVYTPFGENLLKLLYENDNQ